MDFELAWRIGKAPSAALAWAWTASCKALERSDSACSCVGGDGTSARVVPPPRGVLDLLLLAPWRLR